ncbi:hypothetical protein [uncultured Muribaculum sp.]|uniref:hypothetical protein n=1 Tax=uncultured Muribaculum sp. TaxID=1918613 RepID=UPI0026F0852F|nr:hypothetical protein [uncultured Muribaculum sp.]
MKNYIDTLSIHDIPLLNARAAIVTKTSSVFRENDNLTTRCINGKEYVAWGEDDQMPYDILDLIEADETLATCQVFNAEVCYGSGLRYCTAAATKAVQAEVEDFVFDNPLADYFLGVCQDLMYFNFAVSVIILNDDGTKIVELHRKPACYCRFCPADAKTGKITKVLFGPFRNMMQPGEYIEEIELLDPRSPWKDLQQRMGLRSTRSNPNGERSKTRKFAILSRFPGVDSMYYPIPHYAALFRGNWYNIKRLIGAAKESKLKNAAPIKYIIEVSSRYWDDLFAKQHIVSKDEQVKLMNEKKREMLEFLTNVENTGSVLFTGKSISLDGKGESPDITVTPVDSKTKEGGDWESDIAEAVNMLCFTMRVHSNLVGSVPGKSQTNNSGSDKRELYTIAQALKKPYRDVLFPVHEIIIRYNGWKGVHPDCPFIQLTTLDEHADAKEVSTQKIDEQ